MDDYQTFVVLWVIGIGFLILAAFYYWRDRR